MIKGFEKAYSEAETYLLKRKQSNRHFTMTEFCHKLYKRMDISKQRRLNNPYAGYRPVPHRYEAEYMNALSYLSKLCYGKQLTVYDAIFWHHVVYLYWDLYHPMSYKRYDWAIEKITKKHVKKTDHVKFDSERFEFVLI